jgi:Holliday junction resolvase
MSNPSKQKGTAAETAVVKYLKENGFPKAERRALQGSLDKGDISGIDDVVLEIKDHKKMDLSKWVKELETEIDNANAFTGVVVHKKRGTLDVGEWYATMPFYMFLDIVREMDV